MHRLLEMQANQIEAVLASHRIPARVRGGNVTPRFVRFDLTVPAGVQLREVSRLSEEIARAVGVPSARVYRKDGIVRVELPRNRTVSLPFIMKRLGCVPRMTAVLGLDEEGAPLLVRLGSPEVAHALICGDAGVGKTTLLRTMLFSLAMHNRPVELQLVVVGDELAPLSSLCPHLMLPVVREASWAQEVVARLAAEMNRRECHPCARPHIVLAIDEIDGLVQADGAANRVAELTKRGHKVGIHVIACTREIGSLVGLEWAFPLRLVGRMASAEEALAATGMGGIGAERLQDEGDFLLVHNGQVVRFVAARTDDTLPCTAWNRVKQNDSKSTAILSPTRPGR